MKIETSPTVRLINFIVQRFDKATDYKFDAVNDGRKLVAVMKDEGYPMTAACLDKYLLDLGL